MRYSFSKKLNRSVAAFYEVKYLHVALSFKAETDVIVGWGRKKSGLKALKFAQKKDVPFSLLEDGFIRSINLGVDDTQTFSIVEDNVGIYYDATAPSKLENILNRYDFASDKKLMSEAKQAIELLKKYHISKYNNAPLFDQQFEIEKGSVLVIAQTLGDASLEYGMLDNFTTDDMLHAAITENPDATVYLKIHPDVLSGKRDSDIDISNLPESCVIIDQNINPLSLLKHFSKVYTKTSQMGFEALLLGCECVCFGMPFYAGWGLTEDKSTCVRRVRKCRLEEVFAGAYLLYGRYYNPFSKKRSNIIDTIMTIQRHKEKYAKRNTSAIAFGFSWWKHGYMMPYFTRFNHVDFVNPLVYKYFKESIYKKFDGDRQIVIWGKKEFSDVENYANKHQVDLLRVEDGFIRSVGLGSDLTQPYSLVLDRRGIYFDPSVESDLEYILSHHHFSHEELERAKILREYLIRNKLSKYNGDDDIALNLPSSRDIVLVVGQVEDDASIRYGANGMTNLELLKRVKQKREDTYIVYKPHPDVFAGNRVGHVEEKIALEYCNLVVTKLSIDSVLSRCDEVHTMTSLVGFEALMRGLQVYTYGLPFYAGWGLSIDERSCSRRTRQHSIDALTAATLILYPIYLDPLSNKGCEVEVTLEGLALERERLIHSKLYAFKTQVRNYFSRKGQKLMRFRGFKL